MQRERDTHAETQSMTEREAHTEREKDRQTEIERDRELESEDIERVGEESEKSGPELLAARWSKNFNICTFKSPERTYG